MDGSVCCVRGFAWLSFGVHSLDTSLALPVLPGYHAEGSAVSSIFAAQGNLAPSAKQQSSDPAPGASKSLAGACCCSRGPGSKGFTGVDRFRVWVWCVPFSYSLETVLFSQDGLKRFRSQTCVQTTGRSCWRLGACSQLLNSRQQDYRVKKPLITTVPCLPGLDWVLCDAVKVLSDQDVANACWESWLTRAHYGPWAGLLRLEGMKPLQKMEFLCGVCALL